MTEPAAPRTYADNVVAYSQAGWCCIPPVPPRDKFPPIPLAEPVALYRHVDRRGLLLYVGISSDPARRWEQHLKDSFWVRFVATIYVQWCVDRAGAQRAERAAIRHEEPIFNTARPAGARKHNDRKVAYLSGAPIDAIRRVPCRLVPGDFCTCCGPDAWLWLEQMHERVMAEIRRNTAC